MTDGRVALERGPGAADRLFLRGTKPIEVAPEFFDRPILIVHASGGTSIHRRLHRNEAAVLEVVQRLEKISRNLILAELRSPSAKRLRSATGSARISSRICSAVIGAIEHLSLAGKLIKAARPLPTDRVSARCALDEVQRDECDQDPFPGRSPFLRFRRAHLRHETAAATRAQTGSRWTVGNEP